MKYILVFSLAAFLFGGCIKTNYIDTGLADGNYDGTLLDYLESCPGTWDSAVVAIRHAGLESLFDGTSGEYPDGITFFGFTNYSVRNFLYETRDAMWQQMYRSVREIPADVCCRMVLQYVIPGRYVLDDFAYEVKGDYRPGDPMVKCSRWQDCRWWCSAPIPLTTVCRMPGPTAWAFIPRCRAGR